MGVGTLMRKGLEGLDAGERYNEHKEDRAVQKETAQLGLDDAKFRAGRRDITAQREDVQHDRAEKKYQHEMGGKKAISDYMVGGDIYGITNYLNNGTREGVTHYLNENEDGSIDGILDGGDKQIKKKFKNKDELMQYVMMIAKNDPESVLNDKKAAKVKAGDRQHDMDKIDRKGMWDMKKLGAKNDKKKGDKISDQMEARSKSRRGKMTGLGTYDMAGISADLANYDGVIGSKLVNSLGLETNAAYTKAYNMVSQLHKKSEAEAIQKFPDDDVKQAEHIRASLEQGANKIAASIDAKSKSKGLDENAKGDTPMANPKQPSYNEFLKAARKANPKASDELIKQKYNERYKAKPSSKPTKQGVSEPSSNDGLVEPKNKNPAKPATKMTLKEEVEQYRTPTRKPTKGFNVDKESAGASKAKSAANKAVKEFKKGVTLSEPELRLALNGDAPERIQRQIIAKIKEIKSKRQG